MQHGSPDALLSDGVTQIGPVFERWASRIVDIAGLDTPARIIGAVSGLDRAISIDAAVADIERHTLRGLMLGALDGEHESALQLRDTIPFIRRPFKEAIAYFEQLKVVDMATWINMQQEARSRAFTIGWGAREGMIEVVRDELVRQLAGGASLTGFRGALAQRFETAGWTMAKPSHVELVFRNAVQRSYAGGRRHHALQEHVLLARPYWQIVTADDGRTRKTHRAVNGWVLRATDSFWSRAPLPWGHNCRCRFVVRGADWIARTDAAVRTGAEAALSRLPDRGWVS